MNISETIQTVIVVIAIACAAAYASWRIYKALTAKGNTCAGCPLKDTCQKDKRKHKKYHPSVYHFKPCELDKKLLYAGIRKLHCGFQVLA